MLGTCNRILVVGEGLASFVKECFLGIDVFFAGDDVMNEVAGLGVDVFGADLLVEVVGEVAIKHFCRSKKSRFG